MIIKERNKILIVVTDYSGFLNFLSDVAARLIENGFVVYLLTSRNDVIVKSDNFKYKYHDRFHRYDVSFPRGLNFIKLALASIKLRRLILLIEPHIIHIHFTSAIFCSMLMMPKRFYTIGTFHGLNSNCNSGLKRYFWKLIEYFSFWRLKNIDVLNYMDLQSIPEVFKKKSFIHSTIGVGCRTSLYNPNRFSQTFKDELKSSLGISKDDLVLIFVGRFTPFKGFNELIGAMEKLKRYSDIKLILVGGTDPLHPISKSISSKIKIRRTNIINTGFQSHPEEFFSIADVFIFPSFREGLPVVVMESLSMEIPVITLNSRGCDDLIQHGFNGFKIDYKLGSNQIANAIAHYVEEMKANPSIITRLKTNIYSSQKIYSRDRYVESQLLLYDSIINNS